MYIYYIYIYIYKSSCLIMLFFLVLAIPTSRVYTWYSKLGIDKSALMEWKGKVINNDNEKMKTFYNETSSKVLQIVLQQNNSLNTFNDFHPNR